MGIYIKKVLLFCAGVNWSLLNKTGGYLGGSQHTALGCTVLCTSLFAATSATYALHPIYRSRLLSLCLGLLWGSAIFSLDRYLIGKLRERKIADKVSSRKRFGQVLNMIVCVLPRLVLGVMISVVVALPIQLKLFEREINHQIQRTRIVALSEIESRINQGFSEIFELGNLTSQLRDQLREKETEFQIRRWAANTELQGSAGTLISGAGPAYKQKQDLAVRTGAELRDLTLSTGPVIEKNESTLTSLSLERDLLVSQAKERAGIDSATGMLQRIEALRELANVSPTIWWASVLLTLLFILLEIAPIVIKLLSGEDTDQNLLGSLRVNIGNDGTINSRQVIGSQYGQSGFLQLGVVFLELILPARDREHLIGDLLEEYEAIRSRGRSSVSSLRWFFRQIVTSLTPLLFNLLVDTVARKVRK